jgi:archaellum biogenesis protein FlaJ (TadC family)
MDLRRLSVSELVAMLGAAIVAISLFLLPAYETTTETAEINEQGGVGETFSAWEVHDITRWLILLAAIAPFILAWIILRDHQLSWGRGEMTAVISIIVTGLIVYLGIIDRPGEPSGTVALRIGWFGMFAGAVLMLVGSVWRTSEQEKGRKPPGIP